MVDFDVVEKDSVNLQKFPWKKSAALLGVAVWAGPLALFSTMAQSQTPGTGICFAVVGSTPLYAAPSFSARQIASFASGDTAYATTNPPFSVPAFDGTADGNSFIEVAIYDGNIAWAPRYPQGSDNPLLIDLPSDDCPDPGLNAFVFPPTGVGPEYCFAVVQPTNLYAFPSFGASTGDRYAAGDIAFATANPPFTAWVNDGTVDGNSFIEVSIYGGNTAWVPRFPAGSNSPILVDLPSADCDI